MRLLIIVTDIVYALLENKQGWLEDPEQETWSIKVNEDRILVILQFRSQIQGEDPEMRRKRFEEVRNRTTRRIVDVIHKLPAEAHTAFLAIHSQYADVGLVRSQCPGLVVPAVASFSHELHDPEEFVYPAIAALVANPNANGFDAAIDVVVAKQGKTQADRLASLRHRIVRLFVPLIVELERLQNAGSTDEYAAYIHSAYRKEERLREARKLIYDVKSDEDTVARVLRETNLFQSDWWRQINILLPPRDPESEFDKQVAGLFYTIFDEDDASRAALKSPAVGGELRIDFFKTWCVSLDEGLRNLREEIHRKHENM